MTSVNPKQADSAVCPNCKQPVTVPKSTRSFICRSCDAIIKVIGVDAGVELKVVGKSVEDDPTYQAIESDVAAVKAELDDLHARYLVEMNRNYGRQGYWIRNFGFLAVVVGVVVLLVAPIVGGALVGAGVVGIVTGVAINASHKRARQAAAGPISDLLHRMGAQRDLLQRKAARLKTKV